METMTKENLDLIALLSCKGPIKITINSYRQNKILKELDEKFKQLQTIESDYNVLDNDCRILFDKLTKKNFDTLDTRKYRSRFVDEIYDYYIDTRNE